MHIFSSRALLGAVMVAGVLLALTFAWIAFTAPAPPVAGNILAVQTIIPAPTGTPLPPPTPVGVLQTPTFAPGELFIGAYVQIDGTQGIGLRIRSAPGLKSEQLFLGLDAEVFLIQDGPRELDGYTWWYIAAPYDTARAGWAASNYLSVIPPP